MATFIGTNQDEIITTKKVSGTVGKAGGALPSDADDNIDAKGGDDIVAGGAGEDVALLGGSNDRFSWESRADGDDGDDDIDGGSGFDTLDVRTASGSTVAIRSDKGSVELLETDREVILDLVRIERINLGASPGQQAVEVDDLTGTSVRKVAIDLGGDGEFDTVVVAGTEDGDDRIVLTAAGKEVKVTGLAAEVTVNRADAVLDFLTVKGFGGNDRIDASALPAKAIAFELFGDEGNDTLIGGRGANALFGGNGDDRLEGGAGGDLLHGSDNFNPDAGIDTVSYARSARGVGVSLDLGIGDGGDADGDTLVDIENLTGSRHDDSFFGDDGVNVLKGGRGNDLLSGEGGADTLIGGKGIDTASYETAKAGIRLALAEGSETGGDELSSIENVTGSEFADHIAGNKGANILNGGDGDDRLFGQDGNDVLRGGEGGDELTGGRGKDVLIGGDGKDGFAFALGEGVDTIRDFSATLDTILLRDRDFELAIGTDLDADEFRIGAKAKDGNDFIIYNDKTGDVFFDADGNGGGGQIKLAILDAGPPITHDNFVADLL